LPQAQYKATLPTRKTCVASLTEQNSEGQMTEKSKIIKTTELNEQAKQQVLNLWNNEYPEKLSYNSMIELRRQLFPNSRHSKLRCTRPRYYNNIGKVQEHTDRQDTQETQNARKVAKDLNPMIRGIIIYYHKFRKSVMREV
jgi:hypothetical protein